MKMHGFKQLCIPIICVMLILSLTACQNNNQNVTETSIAEPSPVSSEFGYDADSYTLGLKLYDTTSFKSFVDDEPSMKSTYSDFSFDNAGRLISKKEDNDTITYGYDENGRLISIKNEDAYGTDYTTYVYNDIGGVVSSVSEEASSSAKKYVTNTTYTCDEYNRVVKEETVYWDGDTNIETYTYDKHNRVVKTTSEYNNDGDVEETSYAYNAKGDLAKRTSVDNEGVSDSEYQSDSLGHVTQTTGRVEESIVKILYTNEAVGVLEISPETNPELMTPDKWVSVEGAKGLPSPDSCISTIKPVDSDGRMMFSVNVPDKSLPWLDDKSYMNEGEKLEYQKYQLILQDLCGFDLQMADDGVISISKNETEIAKMDYIFDDNFGFCIVIDLLQ